MKQNDVLNEQNFCENFFYELSEDNGSENKSINSFNEVNKNEMEVLGKVTEIRDLEEMEVEKDGRTKRTARKPRYLKEYIQEEECNFLSCCDEPIIYEEAMYRPNKSMWKEVIYKELQILKKKNT